MLRTSSDKELKSVKLWDTRVSLRLMASEQGTLRNVYLHAKQSYANVVDVICSSDSGERIKVVLWADAVEEMYSKFVPEALLELSNFKAKPVVEKFRVGNLHFELAAQYGDAPVKSTLKVLASKYKLQGPSLSWVIDVLQRTPGRHKICATIAAAFFNTGDTCVGRVELKDSSSTEKLSITATLEEVYEIHRYRLAQKGAKITLTGFIEKTGHVYYMRVEKWAHVEFDDGLARLGGSDVGSVPSKSTEWAAKNDNNGYENQSSSSPSINDMRLDNGASLQFCPHLDTFSSIADLEGADLAKEPWHWITGHISETFDLEDDNFHHGEILLEEDEAVLPVHVKLSTVPSRFEYRLVVDTKCSVKGRVYQWNDGQLCLEARWRDFEFENNSFIASDSDNDEFDPITFCTAADLKRLSYLTKIRIEGTVLKRFVASNKKVTGLVKVQMAGIQCVNVSLDWSKSTDGPEPWILALMNTTKVEVIGWAERSGQLVSMEVESIKVLDLPRGEPVPSSPLSPSVGRAFTFLTVAQGTDDEVEGTGNGAAVDGIVVVDNDDEKENEGTDQGGEKANTSAVNDIEKNADQNFGLDRNGCHEEGDIAPAAKKPKIEGEQKREGVGKPGFRRVRPRGSPVKTRATLSDVIQSSGQ